MSKVINFNARDFKVDCEDTNSCERMFFTAQDGTNSEMYKLGDWGWTWSQIKCEKVLEKNTDYIFTVELRGGYCDTQDENVSLHIFFDENWEDRYTYPLVRDRFKAKYSKLCNGDYVRVFEIPFNTGDAEKTTIVISSQHAVSYFTPMQNDEFYQSLDDYSYEKVSEKIAQNNNFGDSTNFTGQLHGCNLDLQGAEMSAKSLNMLLKKFGDGCNVDLSGVHITDDEFDDMDEISDGNVKSDDMAIPDFAKKRAVDGMKAGYEALKGQYENCPENSYEKGALKNALEQFEEQIKRFEI